MPVGQADNNKAVAIAQGSCPDRLKAVGRAQPLVVDQHDNQQAAWQLTRQTMIRQLPSPRAVARSSSRQLAKHTFW